MNFRTILKFAWRYFKAKKSTNAINVISWVSVVAIVFGTASLIVILSAFNGFESLVKSLYASFYPDIKITAAKGQLITLTQKQLDELRGIKDIETFSLVADEKALIQNGGLQTVVHIKGVDENYAGVAGIASHLYRGEYNLGNEDQPGLVFGVGVEQALALSSDQAISPVSVYLPNKKITGTNDVVYEVIYVEMIDPLEKGKTYLSASLKGLAKDPKTITVDSSNSLWAGRENPTLLQRTEPFAPRPDNRITIDQTNLLVSDSNPTKRFPSSISLWRKQLATVGSTERNYLPLWMRSIQPGNKAELDYILAIPLCFCRPGTADSILRNIKFNNFDFNSLDYTIDRYTLSSAGGYADDKYLIFKNNRITV